MSKKWVDLNSAKEVASRGKSYTDSLVGSLSSATQAAISELDETKQEKFDGLQGMVTSFDESGDPTAIPMWSNENLIKNADFRYPENQNGMEAYVVNSTTDPIPCLDDWWLIGHGTLVIEDGYIRLVPSSIGTYVTMYQDISLARARHIFGNPVTVSMAGHGAMVGYFSAYNLRTSAEVTLGWPSLNTPVNTPLTGSLAVMERTQYDLSALNDDMTLRAKFSATTDKGEARFVAVKAERGSTSTIAYKTTSGWTINTMMPSYQDGSDVFVVTGEPAKIAIYDSNGELSSFTGTKDQLLTFDENGKPLTKPVSDIVPEGDVPINENLIPNWNFQDCLNSSGNLEYPVSSSVKECIDGWTIQNGSLTLNSSSPRVVSKITSTKTNAGNPQTILATEKIHLTRFNSQPLTLSFFVKNIKSGSVRASIVFDNETKVSTPVADATTNSTIGTLLTCTYNYNFIGDATVIIEHKDGTALECEPIAVKLEEGDESTLTYTKNGIIYLRKSQSNDTEKFIKSNKRVPIGKNLLINSDFDHFINPEKYSTMSSDHRPIGWEISAVLNPTLTFDNTGGHLSNIYIPSSNSAVDTIVKPILIQKIPITCVEGEYFTLSVVFRGNAFPIVEARGITETANELLLASIVNYRNGFGTVTFKIESNNITTVQIIIGCIQPSTSSATFYPVKMKLESGTVSTMMYEVSPNYDEFLVRLIPPVVNKNVLVNHCFRNWINKSDLNSMTITSGNTYYNAWELYANNLSETVTVMEDRVRISLSSIGTSSYSNFGQKHRINITQRYIFSLCYATNYSLCWKIIIGIPSKNIYKGFDIPSTNGQPKIFSVPVTFTSSSSNPFMSISIQGIPTQTGNPSIDLFGAKLECGNYQTIGTCDQYGNVVFYESTIPTALDIEKLYQRERYYHKGANLGPCVLNYSSWVCFPFSSPFERNPTIINPTSFRIASHLNAQPTAADVRGALYGNPGLFIQGVEGTQSESSIIYVDENSPSVKFDANPE